MVSYIHDIILNNLVVDPIFQDYTHNFYNVTFPYGLLRHKDTELFFDENYHNLHQRGNQNETEEILKQRSSALSMWIREDFKSAVQSTYKTVASIPPE